MKKRVILLRSNPVSPDPPVEKVADTLLTSGYRIGVIGWDRSSRVKEKNDNLSLENGVVKITRFGIPAMFDGGIKKNFVPLVKFQSRLYKWLKKHKDEYDIIHSFDFDTGFIANKIAKKYNKRLIYHILDFYIDSHNIPSGFLKSKVKNAEFAIINNADATILCTEKRREQIAGSKPKRLEIIHNTPKSVNLISDSYRELSKNTQYKIVYVGILAGSRLLREIIKFVEQDSRFELHIGGFGTMENEIAELAEKCERICYYGKLPYGKTLALEQACDIMTAIYDPRVPNHKFAAPNKFYESLMLGKPVIMVKNTGMSEVVKDNNIGVLIDYSEEGFKEGIDKLISEKADWASMSERMKKLYKDKYSWTEMEKRLIDLYAELSNEKNIDR